MSWINAENNRADWELELCETLEMFSPYFERSLRAKTLLVEQLKRRGNLRGPQPVDFSSGIGRRPQDAALFSNPFLMPEFLFSHLYGDERQAKILPAFLRQQ